MTADPTVEPPWVCCDRYPVPVVMPDGIRHSTCKVFLTAPRGGLEPRLLVFRSPDHCIADVVWDPATSDVAGGDKAQPWSIVTTAGVFSLRPGRGCGSCGRMARWSPFGEPERRESLTKVMRQAREVGEQ